MWVKTFLVEESVFWIAQKPKLSSQTLSWVPCLKTEIEKLQNSQENQSEMSLQLIAAAHRRNAHLLASWRSVVVLVPADKKARFPSAITWNKLRFVQWPVQLPVWNIISRTSWRGPRWTHMQWKGIHKQTIINVATMIINIFCHKKSIWVHGGTQVRNQWWGQPGDSPPKSSKTCLAVKVQQQQVTIILISPWKYQLVAPLRVRNGSGESVRQIATVKKLFTTDPHENVRVKIVGS